MGSFQAPLRLSFKTNKNNRSISLCCFQTTSIEYGGVVDGAFVRVYCLSSQDFYFKMGVKPWTQQLDW